MGSNAVIVIPALNPPSSLAPYVSTLIDRGFSRIIVVNDGSRTDKLPIFTKLKRMGAFVIDHDVNRGQGASLKTGFQYYLDHFSGDSDGVITLSADRPVHPEDVEKIASSLHNEQAMGSFALVVGTRDLNGRLVSDYDYHMGGVMKLLYHMLMGVRLNDPLSGVFGIPDLRVAQCVDIEGDRFSYVTSLTMSFEKIGFLQVPIEYTFYEPDTERTYRKVGDTVLILFTIFKKFIIYSITSVSASILDIVMFSIFTGIVFRGSRFSIIYATICARLISASANYLMTKNFVFHFKSDSAQENTKSAGAFMLLSAAQCLCSAFAVSAMKALLGGSVVGIKVLVDLTLFFISYKIQHKYIFKDDQKQESPEMEEQMRLAQQHAKEEEASMPQMTEETSAHVQTGSGL